jgi:uncharacterized protein YjdB
MTVLLSPAAITGVVPICEGATLVLSDSVSGGLWTSHDVAVATIGSTSGLISAVSAGTVAITYSLASGCEAYASMTIDPLPAPITGITTTIVGNITTLGNTTTGGSWTSGDITIASVSGSTGDVTGLSPGTVMITYTLPTGCYVTTIVTILPPPTMTATNNTASKLHVYPNPTNGLLNIQWSELSVKNADITITDVVGRLVYKLPMELPTESGEQQIDVKGLVNGIYLISIKGRNINYSSKLIIEK